MAVAVDIPTTPIGYVSQTYGSSTSTWWMYDGETTPELWWPQSITVYDAMRTQDAQVGSVLEAVVRPILRTPWRIDPAGARAEVVEFVAEDLGLPIVGENPDPPPRTKDRFSWLEHLELALLMLPFGHMMFEQIYRVTDDGNRAHLGKLEPRMPKTIAKIDVARDGGLISVTQWGTFDDGPQRPIPVDRLVAYVYKREGGNWLGRSILRQAYKNWLLKDRLLRVQAQTIERNGMGIPVATDAEGASPDQHAAGLAMAKALRAGEAAGIALPFGATLTLMGVSGTLPDAQPAIDYHDNQIARAVLAHFLNLGQQTGTGSYALGVTFADFFTASLQTLAQQVADVATMHIVEDLVDKNWGPEEPAPKITFDEIGSRQAATAQSITALINAGALTPDARLEESLRQQYGLPPKEQPADATGTAAPLLPPDQAQTEPEPVLAGGVGPKGVDQPVSASIDDDEDDEPGQFESTEDIDTAALVAALASFCGEVHAAEFNDKLHPRGAGGRFRNTFARIVRALEDWANGDGPNNANPFEGHGFTREQLRDAAKKRGVKLRHGAPEEEIVKALMDDVRAKHGGAKAKSPDAGKPVRFTLTGGSGVMSAEEKRLRSEMGDADFERRMAGDRAWIKYLDHGPDSMSVTELKALADRWNVSTKDLGVASHGTGKALGRADLIKALDLAHSRGRVGARPKLLVPDSPNGDPKLRNLDVGVFTEPSGKLSLWEVSDSGERRKRVALVDDLAGLESWADEHGEPELAGWARKERGGTEGPAPKAAAPAAQAVKKAAPSPQADEAKAILVNSNGSTYELEALLGARSKRQLAGIAEHLGIDAPDKATAAQLRERIQRDLMPEAGTEPTGRFDVMRLNDVLTEMAEPAVSLDVEHSRGARAGWPDVLDATPGRSSTASAASREALHDYKSDEHFREVNDTLFAGNYQPGSNPIIDGVRDAMRPLDEDVVVWRGGHGLQRRLPRGSRSRKGGLEGAEWTRTDFASTSADEKVARDFALKGDGSGPGAQPTVMRIRVPKGTSAVAIDSVLGREGPDDISRYLDEQEIVLDGGLSYRITKDYGVVRGVRQLDVEVVPASAKPAPSGGADPEIKKITDRLQSGEIDVAEATRLLEEHGRLRQEAADKAAGRTEPGNVFKPLPLPPKRAPAKKAATPATEGFAARHTRAVTGGDVVDATPGSPRDPSWFTNEDDDGLGEYEAAGQEINEFLRADGKAKILPRQSRLEQVVAEIDAAMDRSRTTRDVGVWRGVYGLGEMFGRDGDLTGAEWTEKSYVSTTIDESTAEHYARFNGEPGDQAVMRVLVPAGTPAITISEPKPKGSGEVALARGQRYRVVADHGAVDGVRRLDVEVVPERGGAEPKAPDVPAKATPAKKATKAAPTAAPDVNALRTLDTDARRDSLDLRKVDELKAMLREQGLPVSGKKRDLVDRLVGHLDGDGTPAAKAAAPPAPATGGGAKPVPIHDLFKPDTSDATIEAALKDVFEGKFGPYTTKADVSVTRAGTDKRGRKTEPSISIGGKIYDEQGNEIGYFGRNISPVDLHYADGTVRREVWADHKIVQLGGGDYDENPTKYHGKGFGGEFNRRAIEWYRASGVHGISQSDHNGYVWASQGFNFSGGVMPDYKVDELRNLIAELRAGETKHLDETIPKQLRDAPNLDAQISAAEELLQRQATTKPGEPGYPTAYEVSQLGRSPGQRGKTAIWLGKFLKVSAGEMVLNPDEGEVISQ